MSIHNCPECLKLWQVYLKAATDVIVLKQEHQLAVAANDLAVAERVEWAIETAEEERKKAKQAAEHHHNAQHRLAEAV